MGDVVLDLDELKRQFFELLESMDNMEWYTRVNAEWTVKDVVAHLIAWEEESAVSLKDSWKSKQKPWFLLTKDYSEFNKAASRKYRNYKPKDLIDRWKFVMRVLDSEIKEIGVGNLRRNPELFEWVFDEGEDNHYLEYFLQIKKALER